MNRVIVLVFIAVVAVPTWGQAQTEEVLYVHTDAVGSVRMLTDANGQVVERYDYLPFGEPWPTSPTGDETRRFTGQERDPETGFDYLRARFYASGNGRFTRPDDPGYADALNPQTWNLYAYVGNNPLKFIDPTGHVGECPPDHTAHFCTETDVFDYGLFQFLLNSWFGRLAISPVTVDFSAGFGDGLLWGAGSFVRRGLEIQTVDECSAAYGHGGWAAFTVGAGRLAYAGLAKAGATFAATDAGASAFREGLKRPFRLNIGTSWRSVDVTKYQGAQLRYKAGKTNPFVNAYGAGVTARGGAEGFTCAGGR